MFQEDNRLKMKTMGRDSISINREVIDVRYVEQLMDTEQLAALGYMLKYMQIHFFDGKHTLTQAVDALWDVLQKKGIAAARVVICRADLRCQESRKCLRA